MTWEIEDQYQIIPGRGRVCEKGHCTDLATVATVLTLPWDATTTVYTCSGHDPLEAVQDAMRADREADIDRGIKIREEEAA